MRDDLLGLYPYGTEPMQLVRAAYCILGKPVGVASPKTTVEEK
jgi:hypothetical protein